MRADLEARYGSEPVFDYVWYTPRASDEDYCERMKSAERAALGRGLAWNFRNSAPAVVASSAWPAPTASRLRSPSASTPRSSRSSSSAREREIDDGILPSCQLAVARRGKLAALRSSGA